jgi:hypothetical protein
VSDNDALLRITLSAAVPLWIERLRTTPLAELMKRAPELADVIASKGDVLQYKRKKGESAHAFNALAEALAIMSFCPGGVTFAGDHWESTHQDRPSSRG